MPFTIMKAFSIRAICILWPLIQLFKRSEGCHHIFLFLKATCQFRNRLFRAKPEKSCTEEIFK